MNFVKRYVTTLAASFDHLMSHVENHEALIGSALREMQTAAGKARAELNRVEKDGQTMAQRIQELNELKTTWEERALKSHETDRTRALECVRRKTQAEREVKHLEHQLVEHSKLQVQLNADLRLIGERIEDLKRKKHAMAARQHRAQALQIGQVGELGIIAEVDEIFERWETKINQCETFATPSDTFSRGFEEEEESEELGAALDELINARNQNA